MDAKPCVFIVCWTWILLILPQIAVGADSCLTANLMLENGEYFISKGETLPSRVNVSSNITACCNEGFYRKGLEIITCLSTGVFSPGPTCEDIDECSLLYNDEAAQSPEDYSYSVVSYSEAQIPVDQLTCQGTSIANAIPPEEERCHIEGAICANTVGSFSCLCKMDYIGDGIDCTRDTEPCPELSAPEHGSLRLSSNNRSATFSCLPGYDLYGCTKQLCVRGKWVSDIDSDDRPQCNAHVCRSKNPQSCPDLPSPVNGTVYLTGRTISSLAFYDCDEGFQLLGDSSRRCLSWGWSGSRAKCLSPLDAVADSLQRNVIDNFAGYTNTSELRIRVLLSADTPSLGVDMVFALDRSFSISEHDFELAVNFTKLFVEKLGVSYDNGGTRFAALTFADEANIAFNLTSGEDTKEKVLEKLDTLKNATAGATGLKEGLEAIYLHIQPDVRINSKRVAMILTDGKHNTRDPMELANFLKTNGWEIFTVGIGSYINETALKMIASSPPSSHYLFVQSYDVLGKLTNYISGTEEDFSPCGVPGNVLEGEALVNNSFEAAEKSWPWLAYIYTEEEDGSRQQLCSGALICNQWVLTAASCFDDIFPLGNGLFFRFGENANEHQTPFSIKVVLGEHNTSASVGCEQRTSVENYVIHDGYGNPEQYSYNFALVHLTQPVELNPCVRTVCLPPSSQLERDLHRLHTDTQCYVAGWGSSDSSNPEQTGTVPLQSPVFALRCQARDGVTVHGLTCPQDELLRCRGGRGSPLLCPRYDGESSWSLEGVGNGGEWCTRSYSVPNRGIFARIDRGVVAWIDDLTAGCTANHMMKEELELQT